MTDIHSGSDHDHDKKDNDHQNGHDHEHGGFLGENTELYFAIGSGVFWVAGLILSFINGVPESLPTVLYIIAFILGGYFTLLEAIETIRGGKFEIDFLMLVAAAGAAALGKWEEGALLLFLFSLSHALEAYAMNKARKSIAALSDLAPPTAIVKRDGKQQEIDIEELIIGDIIIVKPNTKIAADGVVVDGTSAVDQAPITGESMPVNKIAVENPQADFDLNSLLSENRAFAGSINGSGVLEVMVLNEAKDSTLSRLVELVKEAESQKSPTQLLTDKFQRYFVPSVLLLVFALLFAFDKTGTLTEGKPKLTNAIPFSGVDKDDLLAIAVSVERLSDHPLAGAIVKDGEELLKNKNIPVAEDLEALTARGIRAIVAGKTVHIGNRRLFKELTGKEIPTEITEQMATL